MTETYQSLGSATSPLFSYIGVGAFALGSILIYVQRTSITAPLMRWIFVSLMSLSIIVCGAFALPMAFLWVALALGVPLSFALSRHDRKVTPKLRVLSGFSSCFAFALLFFASWMNADQKVMLNPDAVSSVPTGIRSRRTEWRAMLGKSGMRVDATVYPGTPLLFPDPWIEWKVTNTDQVGQHFFMHSGVIFWGPHGLITADQLAKRIASWAGTAPKYKQWANESDSGGTPSERSIKK